MFFLRAEPRIRVAFHRYRMALTALLGMTLAARGEDPTAFFEARIRPLLLENCVQCHGPDKQKGSLRLDSREGWVNGGDSGSPIAAGHPDSSLLIKAVRYQDRDLKMPPKKKLTDSQVADLEQWIQMGAPDPRVAPVVSGGKQKALSVAEGRSFWSYQLPKPQQPPPVKKAGWARNEIDAFILAKLEEKNLSPSPDADAHTLVRRLYFDLWGLPPTAEQLAQDSAAIAADPRAVDRLVEMLLDAPAFAERWSSHWLDLVRFAESSGGGRTLPFKDAWRYRDYVIESFQKDVPLGRFLTEQLAGDLLPHADAAERRRHLTATGFLALGPTNYEEQDKGQLRMDIVDEQLDTIGKSFLGQTIGCARCHDHKFDPIPTKDYYALAGIFRSTRTLKNYTDNVAHWIDTPLPLDGAAETAMRKLEDQTDVLTQEIASLKDQLRGAGALITTEKRVIKLSELEGIVVDDAAAMKVGEWKESSRYKPFIGSGYLHDDDQGKGEKTMSFTPKIPKTGKYEVRVAFNTGPTRAMKVPVTIFHADGEDLVDIKQQTARLEGIEFASIGTFRFEDSSQGYVMISNAGAEGYVTVDAVQFVPVDEDAVVAATGKNAGKPKKDSGKRAELSARMKELDKQLKALKKDAPDRPEAMTVSEDPVPEDSAIHIRGSIRNLGAKVPRGFLQVAMHGDIPAIPKENSGRLEFAQWLASESNPLTARVYVNRAWHWLFGAGIVRSTENFGVTGELPSHPELLDYLALRFMKEGWSTKKLVKHLVTSRAYLQASAMAAETAAKADPENRLLGRMNRKRLDAECIRDAMLAAAGSMDRGYLGPNVNAGAINSNDSKAQNLEYGYQFVDVRRSVYTPAFRNVRHPLFEVFDFADINQPIAQRTTSTVATQALFIANHPFVISQARAAADKLMTAQAKDDSTRIQLAYESSLARKPTPQELSVSRDYIEAALSGNASPEENRDHWARLIQAIWSTPEFRFLK